MHIAVKIKQIIKIGNFMQKWVFEKCKNYRIAVCLELLKIIFIPSRIR